MTKDSRIIRGSISLIVFALITVSYFINPLKYDLNKCGFKELTGYSCPSCGLTRSFYSTSHFHFSSAVSFHLLGPVIYLFILLLAIKFAYESTTGKQIQISIPYPILKIIVITFFGIWLIYWVVRVVGEMGVL